MTPEKKLPVPIYAQEMGMEGRRIYEQLIAVGVPLPPEEELKGFTIYFCRLMAKMGLVELKTGEPPR